MCTLLVFRRPFPGVEVAVAANRDELYSRPRGSFGVLSEKPLVLGGRDPEAGGSWLAVSERGFLVAVTNARLGARRGADQRSRGLLALDLALAPDAGTAVELLEEEDLGRYAPANAVVAWGGGLVVGTNLPGPRVERWPGETLGLGNTPAFSPDPRVAGLLERARPRPGEDPEAWAGRVRRLLARHDPPAACHHLEHGGTVASTVVLLREPFEETMILHAAGAPCSVLYRRVDPVPE